MAGIADTETIDVIAEDSDGTSIALYVVEDRAWTDEPARVEQLKQKLNYYAGVIVDGSLIAQYPECAEKVFRIQIDCATPPTDQIADVLSFTQPRLAEYGIGLSVNVRG